MGDVTAPDGWLTGYRAGFAAAVRVHDAQHPGGCITKATHDALVERHRRLEVKFRAIIRAAHEEGHGALSSVITALDKVREQGSG